MIGLENPLHIALILVVVLLVFGAKRLPEMGRGLGEGLRSFKDSMQGTATEFKGSLEETSNGFKESLHGESTEDETHVPAPVLATQASRDTTSTPVA
jgi:sec-independent protein translocase protein TatA